MDFIENIQQDSWWKTQTKYGTAAFRSPRIFGRRYVNGGENIKIFGPDYYAWVDGEGNKEETELPENADEVKRWEVEQRRRIRVSAVRTLLRKNKEDVDVLKAGARKMNLDE